MKTIRRLVVWCILLVMLMPTGMNAAEVEPCIHEWDEWEVAQDATIYHEGIQTRTCIWCDETEQQTIPMQHPFARFTKKTVKVRVNEKKKVRVAHANGDKVKRFKSSKPAVVTVTKKGVIKAKKAGTAKITAYMKSGLKVKCKIKVLPRKSAQKRSSGSNGGGSGYGTVYWVPNGGVFHTTISCPTLRRSRTIMSGSLANCPKGRVCKVCS